jgi:hypothetical protein
MSGEALSRRRFLGGAAGAIALPAFESLLGSRAYAQAQGSVRRRLLTLFIPNGMLMEEWTPRTVGPLQLSGLAAPYEPLKQKLILFSQLANVSGKQKPGDHASGTGAAFTCLKPAKGDGAAIRAGVSMDQLAARQLKSQTRIPSIQTGVIPGRRTGVCEAGFSCVYENTISWADERTPMPPLHNPQALFDQMFAGFDPAETQTARDARLARKRSLLDYVKEEAGQLKARLGRSDGTKLDQLLNGVREIEGKLAQAPGAMSMCGRARPGEGEIDYTAKHKLMNDLVVSAFQCDVTRVISYMVAPSYPAIPYNFMGVAAGHHTVSHYIEGRAAGGIGYKDLYRKCQQWHVQMVLDLLTKLDAARDDEGASVLDRSFVLQSGDVGNPRAHDHDHLAVMVAGGGGVFKMGRHLSYPPGTPVANLFISILQGLGVPITSFGSDGQGPLGDLV